MKKILLSFILLIAFQLHGIDIAVPISSENLFENSTILNPKNSEERKRNSNNSSVTWGGSELTQEERNLNGIQVKTFILGGGAFIQSKAVRLTASKIEIMGEDALLGKLIGGVKVEDSENGATLFASKGNYDKLADTVTLEKNPILLHDKKDGKPVKIRCESIVRYLEEAKTILSGKVIVTSGDFQVFGEDAIFFEKEDRIDLKNQPFIFAENRFIQGETLSFYVKEGMVVLNENANIFQVSWESEKKEAEKDQNQKETKTNKIQKENSTITEKKRVISLFRGDSLNHTPKAQDGSKTVMFGNAQILRPSEEFRANEIESKNNNSDVVAKGSVFFLDRSNLLQLESGFVHHNKETNYTYANQDLVIHFLEKETLEKKGKLRAVFLERFGEKKEIVFRGEVEVITDTAKATGEYATYFEDEEKLVMEGNPVLEKDKTKVSSGKILVFPKEDRAVLSEGIRVLNDEKKSE